MAKSLAVDLGNFSSFNFFKKNQETKDKRQSDEKTSNDKFGHRGNRKHESQRNCENEKQGEDSGVFDEIDFFKDEVFTSFVRSSETGKVFSRNLVDERNTIDVQDFPKVRDLKITTKSLSCTKIREKMDTKLRESATLPKKIGKGVRNLSSELMNQVDAQDEGIKCNSCPKTFKTSNKLKMHMMCHTSFSCNGCDKGFRFASLLDKHMEKCEEELQYKRNIQNQSLLLQNKTKRLSLNIPNVANLSSLV